MNISRDSARSMAPYWTRRSATSGTPYRVTRSCAMTAIRLRDQCGSDQLRLTRWAPSRSAHSGSMAALTRAYSREVSTSSAAMTYAGCLRKSPEPGKTANLVLRAPR